MQVRDLSGAIIRASKTTGRHDTRAATVHQTVTRPQEVRPMNAVPMWVLPNLSRAGD